jgi:hypothetical protein
MRMLGMTKPGDGPKTTGSSTGESSSHADEDESLIELRR